MLKSRFLLITLLTFVIFYLQQSVLVIMYTLKRLLTEFNFYRFFALCIVVFLVVA